MEGTPILSPRSGAFGTHIDERGTWTRVFERDLFCEYKIEAHQSSISYTKEAHTLRGLHSLNPQAEEWKLVTCVRGKVWDVAVNVDTGSPSFGSYEGFYLDGNNAEWVLIPPGFAHGFITLTDDVILGYTMSTCFDPALEIGFRFDDPAFSIAWPTEPKMVSDKDLAYTFLA